MTDRLPRVGITVGDPAGIGPEIAVKAASHPDVRSVCEPIVYGPFSPEEIAAFPAGRVTPRSGLTAYETIVRAVEDARAGKIDAVATAPINKEAFAAAGLSWPGHTELLAHLTHARRVAMMFYAEQLRVVLATVHVPLAQVPRLLTQPHVEEIIGLSAEELPRFGFPRPRRGRHRAASRRHGLRAGDPRRVRCRGRVLSRSGADTGQDGCLRQGRECYARVADHPHVSRSWDGVRHRGERRGRPVEHDG